MPHLDAQTVHIDAAVARRLAEFGSPTEAPPHPLLADFNHLLHELRTIELRGLPLDGGVLLSAGCAGRWYFDWLEDAVGPIDRHIGVERYSPEPDDLPANATWIAESASAMPGVDDGSVDVVFSGQNLEHLWIDDMVGFFAESHRVLRSGGWLVVDSPNRLAVEALGWVHPEHTIEITADEAIGLFEAAGFDIRSVRGLWSCRSRSGQWLSLVPEPGDVATILERSVSPRDPAGDFVWWIDAQRAERGVDRDRLRGRVEQLFATHWTDRVNRNAQLDPEPGVVYRTDRFPLFPGLARVTASPPNMRVRVLDATGTEVGAGVGAVDVTTASTRFGMTVDVIADPGVESTGGPVTVAVELVH